MRWGPPDTPAHPPGRRYNAKGRWLHCQRRRPCEALEGSDSEPVSTVLVEVDRVKDLKQAYPNYFLDVTMFTTRYAQSSMSPF